MILHINTTEHGIIKIAISKNGEFLVKKSKKANYNQAEILLPMIDKLLNDEKIKLKGIEKIKIENRGGGFTSLRIGVVTANTLAYALGVVLEAEDKNVKPKKTGKIKIVEPAYSREPNIT